MAATGVAGKPARHEPAHETAAANPPAAAASTAAGEDTSGAEGTAATATSVKAKVNPGAARNADATENADRADVPGLADNAPPGSADLDGDGYVLFRSVRTGNAFEETVERILRAVKLGAVPPGGRLPAERELAALLNVSRDTLREAIRALAAEGIVESRRGRSGGTYVLRRPGPGPQSPEQLRDLVEGLPWGLEDTLTFRRAVECGAAEAAAARALDAAQRRLLTTRMAEAERAPEADYRIADTRYHLAVAELSGSPQLAAAVAEARLRINDLLDSIPMLAMNLRHSAEQHERVTGAILGGDPEAARRAMSEHLDGTAMLLRGFLD